MRHQIYAVNIFLGSWEGLCGTEESFLLPTQLPWVQIRALSRFFSLYYLVGEQF